MCRRGGPEKREGLKAGGRVARESQDHQLLQKWRRLLQGLGVKVKIRFVKFKGFARSSRSGGRFAAK